MAIENCFEGECFRPRSRLKSRHIISDKELNDTRKKLRNYTPKALKTELSVYDKVKEYLTSLKEIFYN